MSNHKTCCCGCDKIPSAYVVFKTPDLVDFNHDVDEDWRGGQGPNHFGHSDWRSWWAYHPIVERAEAHNNVMLNYNYASYLFWNSDNAPWCLLDEDIIHPKVRASKYQITNEFVDQETGLVRVGLEYLVDFQWLLWDVDVAVANKDIHMRPDVIKYAELHPERGALEENCVRACSSPKAPNAIFDLLPCNLDEDYCTHLNEFIDYVRELADPFFPEFNGGCAYDPPNCYDLPFLRVDTTNHDVCSTLPSNYDPLNTQIKTISDAVDEVYDAIISRFGPQILANGEINPYPDNIIFVSDIGIPSTYYYYVGDRWNSWNDETSYEQVYCYAPSVGSCCVWESSEKEWECDYITRNECVSAGGKFKEGSACVDTDCAYLSESYALESNSNESVFPLLESRVEERMYHDDDDYLRSHDPRYYVYSGPQPAISGVLAEYDFYHLLKSKFIDNWGTEVAEYKFNACPGEENENNCFGRSCKEYGGSSGCFPGPTGPNDPIPQNINRNTMVYYTNHWDYFDPDSPGDRTMDPWSHLYSNVETEPTEGEWNSGDWLNQLRDGPLTSCAQGYPWNEITTYALNTDYTHNLMWNSQTENDPCMIPGPWVNTNKWELEPVPSNYRINAVQASVFSRGNQYSPQFNHMVSFTETVKEKYKSPCFYTNIIQEESVALCPCDEDKLYKANEFFIGLPSPIIHQNPWWTTGPVNCEDEGFKLFVGTTGSVEEYAAMDNPDGYYSGMYMCSMDAPGPIPANELGDDFRPDYTAYLVGGNFRQVGHWIRPGFGYYSNITLPLVCDQTGFPEYKLPTRYRQVRHPWPSGWGYGHWVCDGEWGHSDENNDDWVCLGSMIYDPDYYEDDWSQCNRKPFYGTMDVFWSETIMDGECGGDDCMSMYWRPGDDLSPGEHPGQANFLKIDDFGSFDRCGNWVNPSQPPIPIDSVDVPSENCSELLCWDDWELDHNVEPHIHTLHKADECGCCSNTRITTNFDKNCEF
jgi:hypothetical protein